MSAVYQPRVSVIIPTRNSARTLELVINSVQSQTYTNIEIIIVDNNSIDQTKEIGLKNKQIAFFTKGPERSAQRNYGASKSSGQYLVFLDSDIELSSTVIEECVSLAHRGVKVITFPEYIIGNSFWAKSRALEALCYLGDDTIEAPRFYSSDVFWEVGGFDESLTGQEDWDLRDKILRKGYRISRIKSPTMHHEEDVSPSTRIRRKYYYGKTLRLYIQKYEKSNSINKIPIFRTCYYKNWRLLMIYPHYTIAFFYLKIIETIASGLGILKSVIG